MFRLSVQAKHTSPSLTDEDFLLSKPATGRDVGIIVEIVLYRRCGVCVCVGGGGGGVIMCG